MPSGPSTSSTSWSTTRTKNEAPKTLGRTRARRAGCLVSLHHPPHERLGVLMLYGLDADAAKTLLSTLHLRFRKPAYTHHCSTSSISFQSPSRHVNLLHHRRLQRSGRRRMAKKAATRR
jgi:hypothetical protein